MVAPRQLVESFKDYFFCPYGLEPMIEDPVTLDCSHKVSREWAKKVYGEMTNGRCAKRNEKCPQCTKIVTKYSSDPFVKDIAHMVFNTPLKDILEKGVAVMEAEQKEKERLEKEKQEREKEFPFIGGDFGHIAGNWEGDDDRFVKFTSFTPGSAFKHITVYGFNQGGLSISVLFDTQLRKEIAKYLGNHHLTPGSANVLGFTSRSCQEHKDLLRLILKYNQLPQEWVGLLSDLMEAGKWK